MVAAELDKEYELTDENYTIDEFYRRFKSKGLPAWKNLRWINTGKSRKGGAGTVSGGTYPLQQKWNVDTPTLLRTDFR